MFARAARPVHDDAATAAAQATGRSMPRHAHDVLALQRTVGNGAVTALLAGRTVQREPLRLGDEPKDGVWWYTDDRNPSIRLQRMFPGDSTDERRYFAFGPVGRVYRYDAFGEQYVDPKTPDYFLDPVAGVRVRRFSYFPFDYYYCRDRGWLSYERGLYRPMDLLENFRPGDLLYGKEEQRRNVRSAAGDIAQGRKTTADQYNREVVASTGGPPLDRTEMSSDARRYHDFLARSGPGTAAVVDPASNLSREQRLKRSCTAVIHYMTGRGYKVHFELSGVDLGREPGYYTETELRYVLENRRFLNMANILFYRDGVRVATEEVVEEHEELVDEVLARGRIETDRNGAPLVFADLVVESYDTAVRPPSPAPGESPVRRPRRTRSPVPMDTDAMAELDALMGLDESGSFAGGFDGGPDMDATPTGTTREEEEEGDASATSVPSVRPVAPVTTAPFGGFGPAHPAPTTAFASVRRGDTITGTHQELHMRFQPPDPLPPVLLGDVDYVWGGVRWKCENVVDGRSGPDVITLRRLN